MNYTTKQGQLIDSQYNKAYFIKTPVMMAIYRLSLSLQRHFCNKGWFCILSVARTEPLITMLGK